MASPEQIKQQQVMLRNHRDTLASLLQQQAIFGTAYTPPSVIHGIREARENIARIKQILRGWGVTVEDLPDDGDVQPTVSSQYGGAPVARPTSQIDGPALRRHLTNHLSDSELRNLCDDLGIDYENLSGQAKGDKARELVQYMSRRNRLEELLRAAQKAHPDLDWSAFGSVSTQAAPTQTTTSGTTAAPASDAVDFVIITALEEERDAMLNKLPGYQRLSPSTEDIRVYYRAKVEASFPDGEPVTYSVVVTTLLGMGRVQAATATSDAIRRWRPRYVLLVGIAGGIEAKGVQLGDVLVSEQVVDYELQKLTETGPQVRWQVHRVDPRLQNATQHLTFGEWHSQIEVERPTPGRPKRHIGPVATGDKVIAFGEVLEKYRDVWPALLGVEMEAGGAASAVFQAAKQPGFLMIRGVSDFADQHKGTPDVERWREYACDVAASYAIALLKSGPVPPESR